MEGVKRAANVEGCKVDIFNIHMDQYEVIAKQHLSLIVVRPQIWAYIHNCHSYKHDSRSGYQPIAKMGVIHAGARP